MGKYDRYFIFDDPIPYKGLLLYPIKIRDYMLFLNLASCLMLEKNSIKDPIMAMKAISMTYLEYMDSLSSRDKAGNIEASSPLVLFVGLMSLVLGRKDDNSFEIIFDYGNDGRPIFEIDKKKYDSVDFDEIKNIISEQNSLELPDEMKQKEVRDSIEAAREFKQRISGSKTANFEEQMIALALYSGWDLEKIYDMTIRKFISSISRANHMIMSNIYLTASMSGFVTFKNPDVLKGWLADLTVENKDADVTMSVDNLQSKISFEDAKK